MKKHIYDPKTGEHEPECKNIDRIQEQKEENIRNSSKQIYIPKEIK